MRRFRRGFTVIELLAVLAIVGILARFAMPRLWELRRRATAAAVLGDMDVIRHAALNHYQDGDLWPPDYGAGVTPPELVKYLPTAFSFTRDGYQLDFERWNAGNTVVIGVTLVSSDAKLGPQVARIVGGGMLSFSSGGNYTFLLVGIGGTI